MYFWQTVLRDGEPLGFPLGAIVAQITYVVYDSSGRVMRQGEMDIRHDGGAALPQLIDQADVVGNIHDIEFRLQTTPEGLILEYMNRTENAVSMRFQTSIRDHHTAPYETPTFSGSISSNISASASLVGNLPSSNVLIKLGGTRMPTSDMQTFPAWSVPNDYQNNIDVLTTVVSDTSGNIYACGRNSDSATVMKMTPNGSLLWQNSFMQDALTTDPLAIFTHMVIDTDAVYAFGRSSKTAGSPSVNLPYGEVTAFIVRIDQTGNTVWKRGITTLADNRDVSVTTSHSDNLLLNGSLYCCGHYDGRGFVMAINPTDGSTQWVSETSGGNASYNSLKSDPNGNLIAVGLRGTETLVQKISPSGSVLWTKSMIVTSREFDTISVTVTDDAIYLVDSHTGHFFLSRLTQNGVLLWRKQYLGTNGFVGIDNSGGSLFVSSRNTADRAAYITELSPDGVMVRCSNMLMSVGIDSLEKITISMGRIYQSFVASSISDTRLNGRCITVHDIDNTPDISFTNEMRIRQRQSGDNSLYRPIGVDVTSGVSVSSPSVSITNVGGVWSNPDFVIAEAANSISGSANAAATVYQKNTNTVGTGWSIVKTPSGALYNLNPSSQFTMRGVDIDYANGYAYRLSYVSATGQYALSDNNYVVVEKISQSGDTIWTKSITSNSIYHTNPISDVRKPRILVDSSGIYLVMHSHDGAYSIVVTKLDLNGNTVWSRQYPDGRASSARSINGSIHILGCQDDNVMIYLTVDKSTGVLSSRTQHEFSKSITVRDFIQYSTHYYVLYGVMTQDGVESSTPSATWASSALCVARFDSSHNLIWEQQIAITPVANDRIDITSNSICEMPNGDLIVSGTVRDYELSSNGRIPARFITMLSPMGEPRGTIFYQGALGGSGRVSYQGSSAIVVDNLLITKSRIVEGSGTGIALDAINLSTLGVSWGNVITHSGDMISNEYSDIAFGDNFLLCNYSGSMQNSVVDRRQVTLLSRLALSGNSTVRTGYFANKTITMSNLVGVYSMQIGDPALYSVTVEGTLGESVLSMNTQDYAYLDIDIRSS